MDGAGKLPAPSGAEGTMPQNTNRLRLAELTSTTGAFMAGIGLGTLAGTRLLGWDTPDREAAPSAFGALTSEAAYGHTGWTGTQLWIDPARDLFVVFLTNRSLAATRRHSLTLMRETRAAVADAVVRAVERCGAVAAQARC